MQEILHRISPVIARISHLKEEDKAAAIVAEMRENGELTENECYAIAFVWLAGKEEIAKRKARRASGEYYSKTHVDVW